MTHFGSKEVGWVPTLVTLFGSKEVGWGPGWFFMVFHGSRLVFMVFHGSRLVFLYVYCILARRSSLGLAGRRPALA